MVCTEPLGFILNFVDLSFTKLESSLKLKQLPFTKAANLLKVKSIALKFKMG